MVQSLYNFHADFDVVFSTPLERFNLLQASHPAHVPQFSGRVWLAYNQAFCQHVVATKLLDWSTMNAQLYNFHAAGASVHSGSGGSLSELPEPSGADSSQVICWSWNRGCYSAQFACVGLPIAAASVRAPTVHQNAPVILTKHLLRIANADLLLLLPSPCPTRKLGVSGCTCVVLLLVPCLMFICIDCL